MLEHVYQSVSKSPFVLPDVDADGVEYSYDLNNPRQHNAGFDSFLTGICFIAMTTFLKINTIDLIPKSERLAKLKNRIFLLRLQDVNYMHLTGKER